MKRVSLHYIIIACEVIVFLVAFHALDLERDYNIRDPTYLEALQFIWSDQTDKNHYNQSYICIDFANDFRNNAFNKGYRCGYVIIELREASHAIVCFNTSDHGLIFIEPQNDEIVSLRTGQSYLGKVVLRFSITW